MKDKSEQTHFTWADDENRAYCGFDVTGHRWAEDEPVDCPKCLAMEHGQPQLRPTSCRHCGKAWIDRMPLDADDPQPPNPADCPCRCHD